MGRLVPLALAALVVLFASCGDGPKPRVIPPNTPSPLEQTAAGAKLADVLANPAQFQNKIIKSEVKVLQVRGRGPSSTVKVSADGKTATLTIRGPALVAKLKESVGKTVQAEILVQPSGGDIIGSITQVTSSP